MKFNIFEMLAYSKGFFLILNQFMAKKIRKPPKPYGLELQKIYVY